MRPILLVESDPDLIGLALGALKGARLENPVHHAADSHLAMEKMGDFAAAGELPALVLLNLRMPGGYMLLRAARTRPLWRDVPVVAMGADGEETREARELGARAYIRNSGDFADFARGLEAAGTFWATVNYRPADRRPEDLMVTEGLEMQMRVEEAMSAVYLYLSFNPHQTPDLKAFWSNASIDEMNHFAILRLEQNFIRDMDMDEKLDPELARRLIYQNDVELPAYDVVKASTIAAREAILWSIELELGEVNNLYHLLIRLPGIVKLDHLQRLLVSEEHHVQSFERLAEEHGLNAEMTSRLAQLRNKLAAEKGLP